MVKLNYVSCGSFKVSFNLFKLRFLRVVKLYYVDLLFRQVNKGSYYFLNKIYVSMLLQLFCCVWLGYLMICVCVIVIEFFFVEE